MNMRLFIPNKKGLDVFVYFNNMLCKNFGSFVLDGLQSFTSNPQSFYKRI